MDRENGKLLIDDTYYHTEVPEKNENGDVHGNPRPGEIRAIIPGIIIDIKVKKGHEVSSGDVLFILEAMKMYNTIESEISGKVKTINVRKGDRVEKNQLLMVIE